jgi:mono/diheme cytochrome c family protein
VAIERVAKVRDNSQVIAETFKRFEDRRELKVCANTLGCPVAWAFAERNHRDAEPPLFRKTIPLPLTSPEPQPARTTSAARGEYLVRSVAGCGDCHTPADDKGRPIPGMEFGGGGPFHDVGNKDVFAANITQDASGIAHYDEALFIQTLHTGQLPGRMLSHIMPFEMFKNVTDDDLRDIFAYLKTLPPVKHRINNTDPPTDCPLCKQKHGLGNLNKASAQ